VSDSEATVTEVKELLRTAIGVRQPEIPDLDAIVGRAGARRRHERVLAGTVALLLTAALATGLAIVTHTGDAPAPLEGTEIVGPTRQVYIPSESMTPTLQVGDTVLVDEGAYVASGGIPERGDVIAFDVDAVPGVEPGSPQTFVKRVVGLPGDVVEQRGGLVYVNDELFVMPSSEDHRTIGPYRVEPGHVFVLGDNLVNSNDSRFDLGQVPADAIIGKVVEIFSPDDRRATVEPPQAPAVPGPAESGS
jgi:signal peptidase I